MAEPALGPRSPTAAMKAGDGGPPAAAPGQDVEEADAFIERIAEAVVRKIDERDKINLLAEAVITRLQELGQAPDPAAVSVRGAPRERQPSAKE